MNKPEIKMRLHFQNTGSQHPEYKGGILNRKTPGYCEKFTDFFKLRVRAYFNFSCVVCYKTEIENGKALAVHHVDNNKDPDCKNKTVFVPLCNKCHGLVRTGKMNDIWRYWFLKFIEEDCGGKFCYTKEEFESIYGSIYGD